VNDVARALLETGWRAKRSLGQNFIFDANFLDLLVREAALDPADTVVEFGTGPGQLTERLAVCAGRVVTVEIDPRLHAFAKGRLAERNVDFVVGDALGRHGGVSDEVAGRVKAAGGRVRVVSNFPYAVAGALLVSIGEGAIPAVDAVGTVQLEVAERLVAGPSTEAYGPLGILVQRLARTEILRRVPPRLFWPSPKVDSALIRVVFERRPAPGWDGFKAFIKGIFGFRRKTLGAGLRRMGYPSPGPWAANRPEELTPGELEELWRTLSSRPPA
jgi:16S rRNA (adenine1518-N6/adenine1519-N6)-dimethyltransferase